MKTVDPKWQTYLTWLADRGLTTPRWVSTMPDAAGELSFDAVFVTDLPLKPQERTLLEKMAEALGLAPEQWTCWTAVKDAELLASGVPDAATLDQMADALWQELPKARAFVAFGPLATRIACGKGSFSTMRGQILDLRASKIVPTYHPRDLLRLPDLKRDAWTDLQLTRPLFQK